MVNPDKIFGRLGNRMFQMAYIYSQMRRGQIPDLFVQNYQYFDEFKNEIRQWFGDGIGYLPYTAIHLRVGKNPSNTEEPRYSENPFYYRLIETGYYIDAVNLFPQGKFIVFSDDIEFAKTYFEGDKFAFDESENDLEAFNKMASCQNQIIANSSFSWWAAYLNNYVDRKVVAPKLWFADGTNIPCPPEWVML